MDNPILLRRVLDQHDRPITFKAAVLAAATTARAGAPRWTELTVYRLPEFDGEEVASGGYVVARVGKSLVVHRPDCARANPRRMTAVARMDDKDRAERVACLECRPRMNPMPPILLVERTRHSVTQARTPEGLMMVLRTGRPGQPPPPVTGVIAEAVRQVRLADPDFDFWIASQPTT